MFSVTNYSYCNIDNIVDQYQGVKIEIFLQRPIFGNFLTQFLPTLLILTIW